MLSAQQLREHVENNRDESQSQRKRKREDNLHHDFWQYYRTTKDKLYDLCLQNATEEKYEFYVQDYQNICQHERGQYTNIKQKTFYTGFWNNDTKVHDTSAFQDVGIPKMLLEELQDEFAHFGYCLTDVSRDFQAHKRVLKITIG